MNVNKLMLWHDVKGFLLDVYGVLYDSGLKDIPINGSIEAIRKLRAANIPFRMCSNTSTRTPLQVVNILQNLGFDVLPEEVFTTIPVAVDILQKKQLRPFLILDPCVKREFSHIDQTNPNCVVLGDATKQFSFENMNKAFQILYSDPKNILMTLGNSKYYKEPQGLILDCGAFAKTLEFAANKEAYVIGKPSAEYFLTAVESMHLQPQHVVMIGDDIMGDVGGAQNAGLKGILVRTGKYGPQDETNHIVKADMYADSLLSAVNSFFENK